MRAMRILPGRYAQTILRDVKNEQYSWKTSDGLTLQAQSWAPAGKPKAAVALVHGVNDHAGRYPRVVELLTAAGYAVNGFDQRGQGRSEGPRVFAPSYDALLGDIDVHLEQTRARFPAMPLFLYGHSFGGAQVLYYAMKRRPTLAGVVASSPGLGSGVRQSGLKILVGKLLSRVAPTVQIPLGSPASGLSHDPAVVEAYARDPLVDPGLSARIAMEMLKTNAWIVAQESFPLPLLIMQGTADQHVDAQLNIAFAGRLSGDVTLKVWEGLGHELHNEVQKDEVIAFMRGWLDKHVD
jgi:alpha-beta hydrolase superfamily lysophospholipase